VKIQISVSILFLTICAVAGARPQIIGGRSCYSEKRFMERHGYFACFVQREGSLEPKIAYYEDAIPSSEMSEAKCESYCDDLAKQYADQHKNDPVEKPAIAKEEKPCHLSHAKDSVKIKDGCMVDVSCPIAGRSFSGSFLFDCKSPKPCLGLDGQQGSPDLNLSMEETWVIRSSIFEDPAVHAQANKIACAKFNAVAAKSSPSAPQPKPPGVKPALK
jgi:hypothetical protein